MRSYAILSAMSTPTIQWTMGERLAKARRMKGWNQTELAENLGIGRRSISRYEDDQARPSRAVLIAWAEVTGVPFRWLNEDTITDGSTHGQSPRRRSLFGKVQVIDHVSALRHPALAR